MLRQVGRWNNLPEEILPKLQHGKTELFRVIETHFDPIGGPEGSPVTQYAENIPIPAFSKIKYKNTWYDLGFISGMDRDERPIVSPEFRSKLRFEAAKNGGILKIIIGRTPLDDAFFQYLRLSSLVAGNEGRDESQKAIFEYIDVEKDAKIAIEKQDRQWEAVSFAAKLSEQQTEEMGHILGFEGISGADLVRAVRVYAQNNPDSFLEKVKDETAPYKARIAHGLHVGVVKFNPDDKGIYWNDASNGLLLKVSDAESIQDEYAEFAQTDKGRKVDQVLQNTIKKIK